MTKHHIADFGNKYPQGPGFHDLIIILLAVYAFLLATKGVISWLA